MRVLITGGAGFIGSHLVEFHLKKNDTVHVIDDLSTGVEENVKLFQANPNYTFINADLVTYPHIIEEVCWADRIYHMAAVVGVFKVINDSEKLLSTNISGTERILRAAALSDRNPRIILASTSEVYGQGHARPLSEDLNLVIGEGRESCSAYAVSKIAVEYFGMSYYQHFKLSITIVRIFNTIGPRQLSEYGMVVPRLINFALKNEPIVVYGTGKQTRSFCDVRDLVTIMDKIAKSKKTIGMVLNIGRDEEVTINKLAQLIKKLTNSDSKVEHITYEEAYGAQFEDVMCRRPQLSRLYSVVKHKDAWNLEKTLIDLIKSKRKEMLKNTTNSLDLNDKK